MWISIGHSPQLIFWRHHSDLMNFHLLRGMLHDFSSIDKKVLLNSLNDKLCLITNSRLLINGLYSSLNGFWPLSNRSIFIWGFLKDDILACVEIWDSYRVIISWRILVSFRGFFEDYVFAWWKYLSFHDSSSSALRYFLM
jgi:hypothetical protein